MAQPPRIKLHQGSWYVFYAEGGRSQRTSLRTKDKEIAERRFAGWLEQRELEMSVQEDPTIDFVLDGLTSGSGIGSYQQIVTPQLSNT